MQQEDIISRCQDGTGQWFLESSEFAGWVEGAKRTLFCPGIPGGGKTFMTAIVVDTLHRRFAGPTVGIAVLYCNYKMREEQNARTFLAGLLGQLLKREHTESPHTQSLVEKCKKAKTRPTFDELAVILQLALKTYETVFIVIDALDECRSTEWQQLTSQLRKLQVQLPSLRLMVTTRPQLVLGAEFQDVVRVDIRAHEADLRRYINRQLPRLSKHVVQTAGLKEEVIKGIIRAAKGM